MLNRLSANGFRSLLRSWLGGARDAGPPQASAAGSEPHVAGIEAADLAQLISSVQAP
jgi:hypothetical protein